MPRLLEPCLPRTVTFLRRTLALLIAATLCTTTHAAEPGVAIIGFETAPGTHERDAWMVTAVEETLSRRLRYADGIRIVPPVRLHLSQRELQDPGQPLPDWPRVVRLLGATRHVTGRIGGHADAATLEIEIRGDNPRRHTVGPARLLIVLDEATDWLAQALGATADTGTLRAAWPLDTESASPLEYYAKAVRATRALAPADAVFYLERSMRYPNPPRSARLMLAELRLRLGDDERIRATATLRTLIQEAHAAGDPLAELEAELTCANAQLATGSYDAALLRQQRALELARQRGDVYGRIAARNALADTHLRREQRPDPRWEPERSDAFRRTELEAAAEQLRAVLALLEEIGDLVGQAPLANKLALICERLKQDEQAGALHRRTLELARQTGSRRTEATALIFLGQWHRGQNDIAAARQAMEACLKLAPDDAKPKVHIALADVLADADQHAAAQQHYESAYRLLETGDDLLNQMLCLERIAQTLEAQNRRSEAKRRWREALDIAEVLELPDVDRLTKEWQKP